jgi:hypothetical protein
MASRQLILLVATNCASCANWQRNTQGGFVFETERGAPFTADALNRLVKRIGERGRALSSDSIQKRRIEIPRLKGPNRNHGLS